MNNNKNKYIMVSYKDITTTNIVNMLSVNSYIETNLIPYIIFIYDLNTYVNIDFIFEDRISCINFINEKLDIISDIIKEDIHFRTNIDGNDIFILGNYAVDFIINNDILEEIDIQKRCLKINCLLDI